MVESLHKDNLKVTTTCSSTGLFLIKNDETFLVIFTSENIKYMLKKYVAGKQGFIARINTELFLADIVNDEIKSIRKLEGTSIIDLDARIRSYLDKRLEK